MDYKLILFDIDDTLCNRDSTGIYPKMRRFIKALAPDVQVALVTNQGGVGYRYWLESLTPRPEWAKPDEFPTQAKVEKRLYSIANEIGQIRQYPEIYVAFAYQFKNSGKWAPTPYDSDIKEEAAAAYSDDPQVALAAKVPPAWRRDWRKPAPGMILQAMKDAVVVAGETLMIGDRPEDEQAAEAAGVAFRHASDI